MVERILYGVKSVLRASNSSRTPASDLRRAFPALPAIWAGFLTALIAAPWLSAGYLFGTDWPGPRRFDFPIELSNSAPIETLIAAASRFVSAEWAGKVCVLGVLFAAAIMAFRAAPVEGFVPRAVASAVYLVNPFVFGRLHYGQVFLLAGYALMPWVLIRVRQLLTRPSLRASAALAFSLASVGTLTVHVLLIAGIVATMLVLAHVVALRKRIDDLKRLGRYFLIAAASTLVLSSYWLLPFTSGNGYIARAIAGTTAGDLAAYAAIPDSRLGLVMNLLGLYGFWAENSGRFTTMKTFVPLWPAILGLILTVGIVGVVAVLRSRRNPLAPWVLGLLISAAIGLVLEMGVSHAWTSGLVIWLDSYLPVYRGMRDAGKWAALLALVYSQLTAVGTMAVLGSLRARVRANARTEWVVSVATGLLIALPLYYGNGLLFGMHGEIKPSHYPAGWYAADRLMAADSKHGRALALPWHEYMAYTFIQNQNKVVVSPSPTFFSVPVLVSGNPEVFGVSPPTNPEQVAITELVRSGSQGNWAVMLKTLGVRYVLLIREVDWEAYRFLDAQSGLSRVGDFVSVVVYRID